MPTINRAIVARIAGAAAVATALFTASFEGNSNKVYVDPVGHLAVCVGHDTYAPDGSKLVRAQYYSDAVCSYLLGQDIKTAENTVDTKTHVPISAGERLAYTDFVFNVGAGAFEKSTALRKLNAGDHAGACKELLRWTQGVVGGKSVTLPGLVKRRNAEYAACIQK